MIKNVYVCLWGVKASNINLIALGVYSANLLIFSQVALVLLYNLLYLHVFLFFLFLFFIFFFSLKAFQFSILELLPYSRILFLW